MRKNINFKRNPAILNKYLLYLRNIKNFSVGTVTEYERDLRLFFDFILKYRETNFKLEDITLFILLQITTKDIYAFLVYINHEKNNCSSTRQRKLAAIKSFFKWLCLNNPSIEKKNPASQISSIELHYRLPKYLTLNEAKKMQAIFNIKNSVHPIRNNAIITLFLSTGMRLSELINVNISDINFAENYIHITGKGNKQRNVYFSNYCKNQLLKYINIRQNTETDALFLSSQNQRLCKSSVEYICKQGYKLMGLENKHYSPHTLRHTAATLIYEYSNNDILVIKKLLGHSTVASTEIYTHVKNKSIKEAVEKNPLSNFTKSAA